MKKNIKGYPKPSPNVMAAVPLLPFYITPPDPMTALRGMGLMPSLPGAPGPRKAKKANKQRRLRTKQARRANRK